MGLNVKQFQIISLLMQCAKLLKLFFKTDFLSDSYDAEKQNWAERSVALLRIQVVCHVFKKKVTKY